LVEYLPPPYIHPDSKPLDQRNPLEKIALEVLKHHDHRDFSIFAFGATVEWVGGTFDIATYFDISRHLVLSFPDFRLEYKLIGETSPGVVVSIVQACGTHTGTAYATPHRPKPLPARNAQCKNDPEYYTCVFQGSKIKHISFLPVSQDTHNHGPEGFYQQIKKHGRNRTTQRRLEQRIHDS
jgi:hypothetical protein